MSISRSLVLKAASAALALGALTGAATSAWSETLIVAHGYNANHEITKHGIEPWMDCVTETAGNTLTFQHLVAGQVVGFNSAIDALNDGLAHVSVVLTAYASNKLPLNGIPLLPNHGSFSQEMVAAYRKALDTEGPIRDEMAAAGLHPVLINLLPPYQIITTGQPIDRLEKFQGLKVRVGGGAMHLTVAALGASPVEIGGGEMYVAMERGTIDGTLLTLSSIKSYGLHELAKSISGNASLGSGTTVLAISDAAWSKLDPEQQEAAEECGRSIEAELARILDEENDALKAEFAASGINVFDVTSESSAEIEQALDAVPANYIARLQARNLPVEEAYKDYLDALGR